jgi:hypothetical protein
MYVYIRDGYGTTYDTYSMLDVLDDYEVLLSVR